MDNVNKNLVIMSKNLKEVKRNVKKSVKATQSRPLEPINSVSALEQYDTLIEEYQPQ